MNMQTASLKLANLIPMLSSDKDGEVLAAVFAIRKVLKRNDCDLHDFARHVAGPNYGKKASPPKSKKTKKTDWGRIAQHCFENRHDFKPTEQVFIVDMVENIRDFGEPSEKQAKWLMKLFFWAGGEM